MSDMKPTGTPFVLNGHTYNLRFTLNVIDDVQSHYDIGLSQLADLLQDGKTQIGAIKFLIAAMVNEDIACQNDATGEKKPYIDERYVGRYLDLRDQAALAAIYASIGPSMPKRDEGADEGDDPNALSV